MQIMKRAANNKQRYTSGGGRILSILLYRVFKKGVPLFKAHDFCLQSVVYYTCWRG